MIETLKSSESYEKLNSDEFKQYKIDYEKFKIFKIQKGRVEISQNFHFKFVHY